MALVIILLSEEISSLLPPSQLFKAVKEKKVPRKRIRKLNELLDLLIGNMHLPPKNII